MRADVRRKKEEQESQLATEAIDILDQLLEDDYIPSRFYDLIADSGSMGSFRRIVEQEFARQIRNARGKRKQQLNRLRVKFALLANDLSQIL